MFGVLLLPDAMVRSSAGRRGDSETEPEGAGGSVLQYTPKALLRQNVLHRNSIRGTQTTVTHYRVASVDG